MAMLREDRLLEGSACIILLHGLSRSARSMEPMRRFLEKNGFATQNMGYPSTRLSIEELASLIHPQVEEVSDRFDRVHFVTHSMGGILLRQLQATRPVRNLGRCVMLAPPNKGSHVVDRLGQWAPFRWFNGPAGVQLGTGAQSLPSALGPVDFEVGVLTGNKSINLILSRLLPGPNDGKVAVSHASVAGQSGFRVLPTAHPFVMKNKQVQANTLAFLRTGTFL